MIYEYGRTLNAHFYYILCLSVFLSTVEKGYIYKYVCKVMGVDLGLSGVHLKLSRCIEAGWFNNVYGK